MLPEEDMKIHAVAVAIALPIAFAGAQAPQSPIQLQHVDVTNMDTSVSPCDNFYQYVCGKMNAANPIPPDQIFWGVGGVLEEWNNQVLRGILEKNEAASASRTPNEQKIGDFYASCVNQATEKKDDFAGPSAILLARIDGMHDKREIAASCWPRCTALLIPRGKAMTTKRRLRFLAMASKRTITM